MRAIGSLFSGHVGSARQDRILVIDMAQAGRKKAIQSKHCGES